MQIFNPSKEINIQCNGGSQPVGRDPPQTATSKIVYITVHNSSKISVMN